MRKKRKFHTTHKAHRRNTSKIRPRAVTAFPASGFAGSFAMRLVLLNTEPERQLAHVLA
jgi:hypothetical protein